MRELRQFFWELPADTETRVLVLRGAGRAFCAGLDLKEQPSEGRPGERLGHGGAARRSGPSASW